MQGMDRELQAAEMLTVPSLMECLNAIDVQLSRAEATWLWIQAIQLDANEPARQTQPLSTHEQSHAVSLSAVIAVMLKLMSQSN